MIEIIVFCIFNSIFINIGIVFGPDGWVQQTFEFVEFGLDRGIDQRLQTGVELAPVGFEYYIGAVRRQFQFGSEVAFLCDRRFFRDGIKI